MMYDAGGDASVCMIHESEGKGYVGTPALQTRFPLYDPYNFTIRRYKGDIREGDFPYIILITPIVSM